MSKKATAGVSDTSTSAGPHLHKLNAQKQRRLDALMTKNNRGALAPVERQELQALVRETEELALKNARILAGESD